MGSLPDPDQISLSPSNKPDDIDEDEAYAYFQRLLNDLETAVTFEITDEHRERLRNAVFEEIFWVSWVQAYDEKSLRYLHGLLDEESSDSLTQDHVEKLLGYVKHLRDYYDDY